MKSISKLIANQLSINVASMANEIHREDHFSVLLYAQLYPKLGKRMLYATGLYVDQLVARIKDTEAENLRIKHLKKGKDFYADLIITDTFKKPEFYKTLTIDNFIEQIPVTHLYEFKYLTSFPSLSKAIAREDTYKLQIMGEYVLNITGKLPHLEQFVVMSNRPNNQTNKPRSFDTIKDWFSCNEFKRETQNVKISIIDTAGKIHDGKSN